MPTSMTVAQVMKQLETWSDEKVRRIYQKNGAGENVFGVQLGKLRALGEQLGTNHALALELWDTGNVDARTLAVMLMDPAAMPEKQARALLEPLTYVPHVDELVGRVLVDAPFATTLRSKWMDSKNEVARRSGWRILAGHIARGQLEGVDVDATLTRIERELPDAPYIAQWGINYCLVQIGIHLSDYTERAMAIGERLGHWDPRPIPKGCTSSYAPEWIAVILAKKSGEWKARAAKAVATRMAQAAAGKKAAAKRARHD